MNPRQKERERTKERKKVARKFRRPWKELKSPLSKSKYK